MHRRNKIKNISINVNIKGNNRIFLNKNKTQRVDKKRLIKA